MINIEDFENLLKIDKRSYKNIDIYYIRYKTIKRISDYKSVNRVNPLYFIICKIDGYMEEKNGNKYLIFPSADKNKEALTKCTKHWKRLKV